MDFCRTPVFSQLRNLTVACKMMTLLLVVFVTLAPCTAVAAIYTWTDANGVVHFSDKPVDGAKKIDVPPAPVYSAPSPPASAPVQPSQTAAGNHSASKASYTNILIVQPRAKETLWSGSGDVNVVVSVNPNLRGKDKVRFIVDGQPYGAPTSSTQTQIQNLSRGTHQVSAQVIGPDGQTLVRSDSVTFYLHRPSVLFHKGK